MKVNGNFILLWQGLTTSSLGTFLFNIVGVLWLVKVADSASVVGLLFLAAGIPAAIVTPLGGVLADRFSRRNIIVLADLCNGLVVLCFAALFYFSDSVSLLITWLFITQIVLGINMGIFGPAYVALLPNIVSTDRLAAANMVMSSTVSVTHLIGKGFGGLFFTLLGAPLVMLITGISFILSALSEGFINLPKTPVPKKDDAALLDTHTVGTLATIVLELKQGVDAIVEQKGLVNVFCLCVGVLWCLSVPMVTLPFLVEYHFDQDLAWYGYFMASLSIGLIIGSVYAGRQFHQLTGLNSRTGLLMVFVIILPLLCIGLAFIDNVYQALPLLFFMGISQGFSNIIIITQIQLMTQNRLRGRVMSIFITLNSFVYPFSAFLGGVLIDVLDKNVMLVQGLSGLVGCLLIYPLLMNKALWEYVGGSAKVRDTRSLILHS